MVQCWEMCKHDHIFLIHCQRSDWVSKHLQSCHSTRKGTCSLGLALLELWQPKLTVHWYLPRQGFVHYKKLYPALSFHCRSQWVWRFLCETIGYTFQHRGPETLTTSHLIRSFPNQCSMGPEPMQHGINQSAAVLYGLIDHLPRIGLRNLTGKRSFQSHKSKVSCEFSVNQSIDIIWHLQFQGSTLHPACQGDLLNAAPDIQHCALAMLETLSTCGDS